MFKFILPILFLIGFHASANNSALCDSLKKTLEQDVDRLKNAEVGMILIGYCTTKECMDAIKKEYEAAIEAYKKSEAAYKAAGCN